MAFRFHLTHLLPSLIKAIATTILLRKTHTSTIEPIVIIVKKMPTTIPSLLTTKFAIAAEK